MATEPGWYPDPLGGQGARYWDGTQWDGAIQPGPPTGPLAAREFPEPPPTPPPTTTSRRLWPLWILGLAVVIAVGSAVFVLTRPNPEPTKATPTITPTTTPTPRVSQADQVAAEVQSAMQSKLDSDPDLSPLHLKVVHVDLVNKAGNEYKGIATVKTSRGTSHDVPIDVTSDGDKTLWEAAPGAFLFAIQDMPTPTPAAPPPPRPAPVPIPLPVPSTVENFKICPSGLTGVATDDTSCAFADSVRAAWYAQPGTTVLAYSPVTHQSYLMTCIVSATNVWPGSKRCSGVNAQGTVLIVYID
ncbi:DUF2510 domain-containing protein [Mycolicibacterium sp. CH28]|uniref:DUF2510 domain-containing protein n=1 Tax=Mycolicibacterium sp. CH28 TaxID=2512237 RepID=UPI001081BE8D|nr:DUF2510 domain-containing protein [Mycolicibacterium sp. CH28]TGD84295.1 DUF2510 domain-containing protein [Mycolicibacterium sp. CH28]